MDIVHHMAVDLDLYLWANGHKIVLLGDIATAKHPRAESSRDDLLPADDEDNISLFGRTHKALNAEDECATLRTTARPSPCPIR